MAFNLSNFWDDLKKTAQKAAAKQAASKPTTNTSTTKSSTGLPNRIHRVSPSKARNTFGMGRVSDQKYSTSAGMSRGPIDTKRNAQHDAALGNMAGQFASAAYNTTRKNDRQSYQSIYTNRSTAGDRLVGNFLDSIYTAPKGGSSTQPKLNYESTPSSQWRAPQMVAYAQKTGDNALLSQMSSIVDTRGEYAYNPYLGGRSVLPADAVEALAPYIKEGQKYDQQWYDENLWLREFNVYTDTEGVSKAKLAKADPRRIAAYWHNYVGRQIKENEQLNEQYGQYIQDFSKYIDDYTFIYGSTPTLEDVMEHVPISKYNRLAALDESFGQEKVVQHLPLGTYYSKDIIPGLYYAAINGEELSTDRDYFQNAVDYYMSPAMAAPSAQKYEWSNKDLSKLSKDEANRVIAGYVASGDMEQAEAFRKTYFDSLPHDTSVPLATTVLDQTIGYVHDDDWFEAAHNKYDTYMQQFEDEEGKVAKPGKNASQIHQACYELYLADQSRDYTDTLEEQWNEAVKDAEAFVAESGADYDDIASLQKDAIHYAVNENDFTELDAYLKNPKNKTTCRTVFASTDNLNAIIERARRGQSVSPQMDYTLDPEYKDFSVDTPVEKPVGYDEDQQQQALDRKAEYDQTNAAVVEAVNDLSNSGAPVAKGTLPVLPESFDYNDLADKSDSYVEATLAKIWSDNKKGDYEEKFGADYSIEDAAAGDPVLSQLDTDNMPDVVTGKDLGDLSDIINMAAANGDPPTLMNGVLGLAIPGLNELSYVLDDMYDRYDMDTVEEIKNAPIDTVTYKTVYENCRDVGYTTRNAARIAFFAATTIPAISDSAASDYNGDSDLTQAAADLMSDVAHEDGARETMGVVADINDDVRDFFQMERVEDELNDDQYGMGRVTDEPVDMTLFNKALAIGSSSKAPEGYQTQTNAFINGYMNGDITAEDIVTAMRYRSRVRKAEMEEARYQAELDAMPDVRTNVDYVTLYDTELSPKEYRMLQGEAEKWADGFLIGDYSGISDGLKNLIGYDNIIARGEELNKNGYAVNPQSLVGEVLDKIAHPDKIYNSTPHMRDYGTSVLSDIATLASNKSQEEIDANVAAIDRFNNSGVINRFLREGGLYGAGLTIGALLGMDQYEGTVLQRQLENYGSWFEFGEIKAICEAYLTGKATAQELMGVIDRRVNSVDKAVIRWMNNPIEAQESDQRLDDGVQRFRDLSVESPELALARRLDAGEDVNTLASEYPELMADVDLAALRDAAIDPATMDVNPEELNRLVKEKLGISNAQRNIVDFDEQQLDGIEKLVGFKKKLGQDGYLLSGLDEEGLKVLSGGEIDLESMGLGGYSPNDIMTMLDKDWLAPYTDNEGVGAYEVVASAAAKFSRDVLSTPWKLNNFLFHIANPNYTGFFDRSENAFGALAEQRQTHLQQRATSFETLTSDAIAEVARNLTNGALGGVLGDAVGGYLIDTVGHGMYQYLDYLSGVADVGKAIEQSMTLAGRLPMAISAFANEASNRFRGGASSLNAVIRGIGDAAIEVLTESLPLEKALSFNYKGLSLIEHAHNSMSLPFAMTSFIGTQAKNILTEIGEEEIGMFLGRFFDFGEYISGGTGARESWNQAWDGLGEEAKQTAIATAYSTLLFGAVDMGGMTANYVRAAMNGEFEIDPKALNDYMMVDFINSAEADKWHLGYGNIAVGENASANIQDEAGIISEEGISGETRASARARNVANENGNIDQTESAVVEELDKQDAEMARKDRRKTSNHANVLNVDAMLQQYVKEAILNPTPENMQKVAEEAKASRERPEQAVAQEAVEEPAQASVQEPVAESAAEQVQEIAREPVQATEAAPEAVPVESVEQPAEQPVQPSEKPRKLSKKYRKRPKNAVAQEAPSPVEAAQAEYQNLTPGAQQTVKFLDGAQDAQDEAVANRYAEQEAQKALENDPGIQSSQQAIQKQELDLEKIEADIGEQEQNIQLNQAQLQQSMGAAFDQGVDPTIPSPVVDNTRQALTEKIASAQSAASELQKKWNNLKAETDENKKTFLAEAKKKFEEEYGKAVDKAKQGIAKLREKAILAYEALMYGNEEEIGEQQLQNYEAINRPGNDKETKLLMSNGQISHAETRARKEQQIGMDKYADSLQAEEGYYNVEDATAPMRPNVVKNEKTGEVSVQSIRADNTGIQDRDLEAWKNNESSDEEIGQQEEDKASRDRTQQLAAYRYDEFKAKKGYAVSSEIADKVQDLMYQDGIYAPHMVYTQRDIDEYDEQEAREARDTAGPKAEEASEHEDESDTMFEHAVQKAGPARDLSDYMDEEGNVSSDLGSSFDVMVSQLEKEGKLPDLGVASDGKYRKIGENDRYLVVAKNNQTQDDSEEYKIYKGLTERDTQKHRLSSVPVDRKSTTPKTVEYAGDNMTGLERFQKTISDIQSDIDTINKNVQSKIQEKIETQKKLDAAMESASTATTEEEQKQAADLIKHLADAIQKLDYYIRFAPSRIENLKKQIAKTEGDYKKALDFVKNYREKQKARRAATKYVIIDKDAIQLGSYYSVGEALGDVENAAKETARDKLRQLLPMSKDEIADIYVSESLAHFSNKDAAMNTSVEQAIRADADRMSPEEMCIELLDMWSQDAKNETIRNIFAAGSISVVGKKELDKFMGDNGIENNSKPRSGDTWYISLEAAYRYLSEDERKKIGITGDIDQYNETAYSNAKKYAKENGLDEQQTAELVKGLQIEQLTSGGKPHYPVAKDGAFSLLITEDRRNDPNVNLYLRAGNQPGGNYSIGKAFRILKNKIANIALLATGTKKDRYGKVMTPNPKIDFIQVKYIDGEGIAHTRKVGEIYADPQGGVECWIPDPDDLLRFATEITCNFSAYQGEKQEESRVYFKLTPNSLVAPQENDYGVADNDLAYLATMSEMQSQLDYVKDLLFNHNATGEWRNKLLSQVGNIMYNMNRHKYKEKLEQAINAAPAAVPALANLAEYYKKQMNYWSGIEWRKELDAENPDAKGTSAVASRPYVRVARYGGGALLPSNTGFGSLKDIKSAYFRRKNKLKELFYGKSAQERTPLSYTEKLSDARARYDELVNNPVYAEPESEDPGMFTLERELLARMFIPYYEKMAAQEKAENPIKSNFVIGNTQLQHLIDKYTKGKRNYTGEPTSFYSDLYVLKQAADAGIDVARARSRAIRAYHRAVMRDMTDEQKIDYMHSVAKRAQTNPDTYIIDPNANYEQFLQKTVEDAVKNLDKKDKARMRTIRAVAGKYKSERGAAMALADLERISKITGENVDDLRKALQDNIDRFRNPQQAMANAVIDAMIPEETAETVPETVETSKESVESTDSSTDSQAQSTDFESFQDEVNRMVLGDYGYGEDISQDLADAEALMAEPAPKKKPKKVEEPVELDASEESLALREEMDELQEMLKNTTDEAEIAEINKKITANVARQEELRNQPDTNAQKPKSPNKAKNKPAKKKSRKKEFLKTAANTSTSASIDAIGEELGPFTINLQSHAEPAESIGPEYGDIVDSMSYGMNTRPEITTGNEDIVAAVREGKRAFHSEDEVEYALEKIANGSEGIKNLKADIDDLSNKIAKLDEETAALNKQYSAANDESEKAAIQAKKNAKKKKRDKLVKQRRALIDERQEIKDDRDLLVATLLGSEDAAMHISNKAAIHKDAFKGITQANAVHNFRTARSDAGINGGSVLAYLRKFNVISGENAYTSEQLGEAIAEGMDNSNLIERDRAAARYVREALRNFKQEAAYLELRKALIKERQGIISTEEVQEAIDKCRDEIMKMYPERSYTPEAEETHWSIEQSVVKKINDFINGFDAESAHLTDDDLNSWFAKTQMDIDVLSAAIARGDEMTKNLYSGSAEDIKGLFTNGIEGKLPIAIQRMNWSIMKNGVRKGIFRKILKMGKAWNPIRVLSETIDTFPRYVRSIFNNETADYFTAMFIQPVRTAEGKLENDLKMYRDQYEHLRKLSDEAKAAITFSLDQGLADESIRQEYPEIADQVIEGAGIARRIFRELNDLINVVYARNGIDLLKRRDNYVPHIKEEAFKLFRDMGIYTSFDDVPTAALGRASDYHPLHEFFRFSYARDQNSMEGCITDITKLLDLYLPSALKQIHQTDNIVRLEDLLTTMDESGDFTDMGEGVPGGLSVARATVEKYMQVVAGKKTGYLDRALESVASRKFYSWVKAATTIKGQSATAGNMNVLTANFEPLTMMFAMNPVNTLRAIYDEVMCSKLGTDDEMVKKSANYTVRNANRGHAENKYQKFSNALHAPAEAVDKFVSGVLTRAAQYMVSDKMGIDRIGDSNLHQQMVQTADNLVVNIMASRARGEKVQLLNSSIGSIVGQFLLEPINSVMFMAKDLPKYMRSGKNGQQLSVLSGSVKALVVLMAAFLGHEGINAIGGRQTVFGPISDVKKAINDRKEGDSILDTARAAIENIANDINPFDNLLDYQTKINLFGKQKEIPIIGGVPIVSGAVTTWNELIDLSEHISKAVDQARNGTEYNPVETDWFSDVMNIYAQIAPGGVATKRITDTITNAKRGYALSDAGRFKYTFEPTPLNLLASGLFGPNSSKEGREYVASGYDTQSDDKTRQILDDIKLCYSSTQAVDRAKSGSKLSQNNEDIKNAKREGRDTTELEQEGADLRAQAGMPSGMLTLPPEEMNQPYMQNMLSNWQRTGENIYPYIEFNSLPGVLDESQQEKYTAEYMRSYKHILGKYENKKLSNTDIASIKKKLSAARKHLNEKYFGGDE